MWLLCHYNIVDAIKSKWHTFSSLMFNYSHLHIISWYYLHIKSSLVCLYALLKALQYASSFFKIIFTTWKRRNKINIIEYKQAEYELNDIYLSTYVYSGAWYQYYFNICTVLINHIRTYWIMCLSLTEPW